MIGPAKKKALVSGAYLAWMLSTASFSAIGLAPAPAYAQSQDLDISAQVSSPQVEVGEAFTIEMKALSANTGESPSDPELRVPGSFKVSGPSVGTQSFMQIGPGGMVSKMGISATWQLMASKPGSFTINGPTVMWKGRRVKANRLTVDVVPEGTRPKRPQNPFLRPGGPGGIFNTIPWPFGGIEEPAEEEDDRASENSELAMSKAPDKNLFVRTIADKDTAVIGEQINLSFYIYYRVDFEMTERREAPLSDFVRVGLLRNPGTDPPVIAVVEGRRYAVRLLDRIAVFPVRAGELHTGVMSARFTGRKVGARVLKESNDVLIRVSEPPSEGRPPGYALGNVGVFSMTGIVEPKSIPQGGSVAVTLKISGTGNFPQSLKLPERTGLSFSDPEKRESIEPENGKISGFRTFGYVVKVDQPGSVNLGQVELPYWNPVSKRYEVAKTDLGTISVQPAAPSPSGSGTAQGPRDTAQGERPSTDPLTSLAPLRNALGAYVKPKDPLLDGSRFWIGLFAPPLAFAVFSLGSNAARRIAAQKAAKKDAPKTLSEQAMEQAKQARSQRNTKDLSAALERAMYAAVEHAAGLKARGVLLDELPKELTARGLSGTDADAVADVLRRCASMRFDPGGGSSREHADIFAQAEQLIASLLRRKAA